MTSGKTIALNTAFSSGAGLLLGAGMFAATGCTVGGAVSNILSSPSNTFSTLEGAIMGAVGGATVGGSLGALTGASVSLSLEYGFFSQRKIGLTNFQFVISLSIVAYYGFLIGSLLSGVLGYAILNRHSPTTMNLKETVTTFSVGALFSLAPCMLGIIFGIANALLKILTDAFQGEQMVFVRRPQVEEHNPNVN